MTTILHIARRSKWESARAAGHYRPDSLQTDGFIHCSTPAQLLAVANDYYHGQPDLVLLCIDTAKVDAAVVYEDCYETGQEFPHIYGPLNLVAVTDVVDFPPNQDGTFSMPPPLKPDS